MSNANEQQNSSARASFLIYELGSLSLLAALATRTELAPVYDPSCKEHQRTEAKNAFRAVLTTIHHKYAAGKIEEHEHVDFIEATAKQLSASHSEVLHKGKFRFGVCQKLVNIHLKYLWVAEFIPEPPHCPIDGIVRDIAGLQYDWTTSDSRAEYETAVAQLKKFASQKTLSAWELEAYRRPASTQLPGGVSS